MMNEGAEVEIYRADNRRVAVRKETFGVNETVSESINFHARAHKRNTRASRHNVNSLFVRNFGNEDSHVHSAPRGVFDRRGYVRINDKIRRCDIKVFIRAIDYVEIDVFADMLLGYRSGRIAEREHIAVVIDFMRGRNEIPFVQRRTARHIEKLNEEPHKAVHRLTFYFNRTIEPSAVRLGDVCVFVGDIRAAHKTDFAVDYGDFAVISVVVADRNDGYELVEFARVEPLFAKVLIKIGRNFRHTANVVVHNVNLNAFLDFFP